MTDRILHIVHRFSKEYDKELLQRAAEVAVYKGHATVVSYLIEREKMDAAEAQKLAEKINMELLKVNRAVLLQYTVILTVFAVIIVFSLPSRSYIFAAFFILPAALLLYSMIKFLRRNPLR